MSDLVRTTLLTWPYPGRWELPCRVLDELERHHALPPSDDPNPEDFLGDAGVVVLAVVLQVLVGRRYRAWGYCERSRDLLVDRKSTRLNSSHLSVSRMPSSA